MIESERVRALRNDVLVEEMEVGERLTTGGIILLDDNGKDSGIRPRWARVYDVGEAIDDIKVDNYVLVQHGQWTRRIQVKTAEGVINIQKIKYPDGVLLVSDDKPI